MEIRLDIEGMTCGGCKAAVERVLGQQPGVSAVSVDLAAGKAAASSDGTLDPKVLIAAIEDAGYEARLAG